MKEDTLATGRGMPCSTESECQIVESLEIFDVILQSFVECLASSVLWTFLPTCRALILVDPCTSSYRVVFYQQVRILCFVKGWSCFPTPLERCHYLCQATDEGTADCQALRWAQTKVWFFQASH